MFYMYIYIIFKFLRDLVLENLDSTQFCPLEMCSALSLSLCTLNLRLGFNKSKIEMFRKKTQGLHRIISKYRQ